MSNKTSVSTRYTGSWFTKEYLKWSEELNNYMGGKYVQFCMYVSIEQ